MYIMQVENGREKHINVDTSAAISDQTLPSPEVLFQTLSLRHSCVGL